MVHDHHENEGVTFTVGPSALENAWIDDGSGRVIS
jgi:hypothetical protein